MPNSGHFSRNGFLTKKGLFFVAQQNSLEGLASRDVPEYIDSGVSVSALVEVEDLYVDCPESLLNEQSRRDQHGW